MARLARLVMPGQAHLVAQRGQGLRPVFADATDRAAYLGALHEAAAAAQVTLHGWALLEHEVLLLATPAGAGGLSRMMQALGRRYVALHHRRHGGRGSLWDGRFRCAVVEPGATLLDALALIDAAAPEPGWTSAGHRDGGRRDPRLVDPPELWQLGNTPFEREAAWRARLAHGLAPERAQSLRAAALGGWVAGSAAFAQRVAEATARPTRPRPRGRPRREAA